MKSYEIQLENSTIKIDSKVDIHINVASSKGIFLKKFTGSQNAKS